MIESFKNNLELLPHTKLKIFNKFRETYDKFAPNTKPETKLLDYTILPLITEHKELKPSLMQSTNSSFLENTPSQYR